MLVLFGKLCFVFLAIIGLTACFRSILKKLFQPKNHGAVTIFLSVYGHDEGIEYMLKSLISQYEWSDKCVGKYRIVRLDHHMDPETKFICETISRHYSFVKICPPEKALELLQN